MNMFMALDNFMAEGFSHLAPHKNMYDLNEPRKLSRIAEFPKPVALTIASWHSADDITPDEESERFLDQLAST